MTVNVCVKAAKIIEKGGGVGRSILTGDAPAAEEERGGRMSRKEEDESTKK